MNKFFITVVAILAVGAVAYFGFHQSTRAPITNNPIKIGVVIYPGDGIFYVAQEKGLFKKYGVNVELVSILPDNAAQLLASNEIQMLYLTTDFLPILADSGVEAKEVFAPSMSYGADGMVVTKNIQKISDLKGKDIYLGYGFPSHFLFRYVAAQNGLKPENFKLVNLGPEDVGSSFVGGKISAGMTWEPWLSKAAERKDGKVLFSSKDYPGIIADAVIARTDTIQNRRADVENIMRASFDAIEWWEKNPMEGNAITAKALQLSPEEFAPQRDTIKLLTLQDNLAKFDKSKPLNLYSLVDQASDIYRQDGVIKSAVSGDSVIDSSLLAELR